ncbi:hypothetical protein [Pelagibius sp.]|uniref:hypothetical protein n=1 Tax=Pelagibius sp. TaxID=1931238 RepID=UPI00261D59CE|nr:hypothetical protein [Pelagibius sp.]
MRPLHWLLAILSLCIVEIDGARAFDLPRYGDPKEPIEQMLKPLLETDREGFAETMKKHYGDQGRQVVGWVFDSFLVDDEKVNYVDQLESEELGDTLKRYIYVIRTSSDDFLFLQFFLAKASGGWVAHNIDIQTEISEFIPGWESP